MEPSPHAAETVARLAELDADALWVVYHDYAGLGRAKAVPKGRFEEVARDGVTFAMANWDLAITDEQVPHPEFGLIPGTSGRCRTLRRSWRCHIGPASPRHSRG